MKTLEVKRCQESPTTDNEDDGSSLNTGATDETTERTGVVDAPEDTSDSTEPEEPAEVEEVEPIVEAPPVEPFELLLETVYFDFDKSEIKPKFREVLMGQLSMAESKSKCSSCD